MRQPLPVTPSERGSFLIPVLILTVILGGLSAALLQQGIAERTAVHHHETSMHALERAEAGVVRAEMEIAALTDPGNDGIGSMQASYASGTYDVTTRQDPTFPDRWTIRSRGEHGHSVRSIEVGIRRRESSYFVEGLYSRKGLVGNGSIATDSYDSRLGTWHSQAVNVDPGGPYARRGGHIGSNDAMRFTGTAVRVRGNAIPGPLFEVETTGQPHISGDTMPREHEIPLPPPPEKDFRAAYANNDNRQFQPPFMAQKDGYNSKTYTMRPKGQTIVFMLGGTYFFTDLVLTGGASIVVLGPSKIYVTGALDLTGGTLVNMMAAPAQCLIFSHPYAIPEGFVPSKKPITISGGPGVAAGIYAPYRDVVIGGGPDFYGSIIGQSIDVNGDMNFHYDEALGLVKGGTTVYVERLFWRDLSTPRR